MSSAKFLLKCGRFLHHHKIKNAQKNIHSTHPMMIELCLGSISNINCIVFFCIPQRELMLAFEHFELPRSFAVHQWKEML
jgi:hypothetical protein